MIDKTMQYNLNKHIYPCWKNYFESIEEFVFELNQMIKRMSITSPHVLQHFAYVLLYDNNEDMLGGMLLELNVSSIHEGYGFPQVICLM